ncbi:methyltransferase domain-containing protein [Aromatoleum evansii]|uniref:Methyltransferase domain-containing protein n=1 Tax=Aromatoleum evansii TaxID=59406 RepID=A0ABZ1AJQ5_AROEV|nr:methyltransferase domain-containing protein [Aromatoleum evansii]
MSDNGFYRAFEDRHRGSRDSIMDRLEVYLPFVEPLRVVYPESATVDLGCGRGEWLQLMMQKGFDAVGVDIDEGMLSACSGLGLKTVKQDAIAFLRALADESQCVVSGFHIVEHLPFADLQVLVEEALRVLKPGGLLILETPNPENVAVGTTNFYLDPTHQRPIPPLLLEFLPEHYGFARIKILRLQEQDALVGKESVDLIDVFCGASPDYSVVAQKSAAPSIMAVFDEPFAQSYGIELGQLANRFDAKLDRRFDAVERRISGAEKTANQAEHVLDRFVVLHEKLLAEAVRAERNGAKTALLAEQLCGANLRLRAVEGELAAVRGRAAQFEARAVAAENFVGELEVRIEAAEQRAEDLERRAVSAESEAAEQEYRAGRAYAFIEDLELRVVEAETRAVGLEVHADERQFGAGEGDCTEPACEIQLNELKRKVVAALMQLQEFERRAIAAETRVGELEYQVFEAEGKAEALERRAVLADEKAAADEGRIAFLESRLLELTDQATETSSHIEELQYRLADTEAQARQVELRCMELEGLVSEAELRAGELGQRAAVAEAEAGEQAKRAVGAEVRATQFADRAASANLKIEELERRLSAAETDARNGRSEADRWHERILSIYQSSSWRITAPMRGVRKVARGDFTPIQRIGGAANDAIKAVLRPPVLMVARSVMNRPYLRVRMSKTLHRYPTLRQHLVLFTRNAGLLAVSEPVGEDQEECPSSHPPASLLMSRNPDVDLSNLSAKSRRAYLDLQAAIERRSGSEI